MTVAAAPFPADRALPGLAVAANPNRMREVLQQHLFEARAMGTNVERCRIARIRYRPEDRCLLQYLVTTCDPATRATSERIVIGALYADKRRSARHARRDPAAAFAPDLGMVLTVFPNDRKLPQAARLVEGRDPALEAAILSAFGTGWRVNSWRGEPVRYREQLSLVVRYDIGARHDPSGAECQRTFYLKAYPETAAAGEMYVYLRRLAAATRRTNAGYHIDGPIAYLGELRAVLFEQTDGRSLLDVIASSPQRQAATAAAHAGRALAAFNQGRVPTRRRFSHADYVASLQRPVGVLTAACPDLRQSLARVLDRVRRTAGDAVHGPTHRDMKPDHVLLGENGAALIDLDSCADADPVLDVALMLARLTGVAAVRTDRATIDTAAASFEHAYFGSVPRSWRERLHAYYASSLLEVAAGIFHRLETDWEARVRQLTELALAG